VSDGGIFVASSGPLGTHPAANVDIFFTLFPSLSYVMDKACAACTVIVKAVKSHLTLKVTRRGSIKLAWATCSKPQTNQVGSTKKE
jgi:hypothetical protein